MSRPGWWHLSRWNPLAARAVILVYHRVTELLSDPWSLAVKPAHFDEQLRVLRQFYDPIGLAQLVAALRRGRVPHRSVAITFDDGYADLLHQAKPALERHDIPATVFLPAGAVGAQGEFWWDELEGLLLQPGRLPAELQLRINGDAYTWQLGQAACYSQEEAERDRFWRAGDEAPTVRHHLYRSIWKLLHPLTGSEQQKVLAALREWAGRGPAPRPSHRTLSLPETVALAQGDLLDIGAHTVSHPVLASLPMATQRDEIQQGKTRLEEMVGRPITAFAYPYGKPTDYTAETVALVQEAGFACACSNFAGPVDRSTDPYQLPRLYIHDWDGEKFATALAQWFQPSGG